jgi:hypothetical protein
VGGGKGGPMEKTQSFSIQAVNFQQSKLPKEVTGFLKEVAKFSPSVHTYNLAGVKCSSL